MSRAPLLPLPTLAWVRLALAPALVFVVTSLDRGYQTDFWQHLARGRLIAEAGRVVSTDQFTFTVAGRAMRDNNWLTQVLYFRLFSWGGIDLVQLVNSLALAGAIAGIVGICYRLTRSTGLSAAGGVLVFLGLWQTFLIRPQSFSLLLFVCLYAILLRAKRDRRWLVLPPVMLALWANLHGGFAIGLLLIGTFGAAAGWRWGLHWLVRIAGAVRRRKADAELRELECTPWGGIDERSPDDALALQPDADSHPRFGDVLALALCGIASLLATLLNPYGSDVYRYAGELSRLGMERRIEEWLPPSLDLFMSRVFFGSLLLLVGTMIASRRRLKPREVMCVLAFLPPALVAVRMIPWWMLAITPVIVRLAAEILERRGEAPATVGRSSPVAATCALLLLLMAAVVSLPWLDRVNPIMGTLRSPVRAEADVEAVTQTLLDHHSAGRTFARMEWGNYLCWALGAKRSVFMEGHVEMYPNDLWEQYLAVTGGGAGWDRVLDQYGVDTLLLDKAYHFDLLRRVRASSEWVPLAASGDALLFGRRDPVGFTRIETGP